jgi:RHS repeat-associated protein
VDKFNDQYFSAESNQCEVPTCTSINATVPVYGVVSVSVADSASNPQEGLSVIALNGLDQVGSAAFTGSDGVATLNLPEGNYRFNTEFHQQQYYSGTSNHCTIPTCTTTSITVPVFGNVTVSVTDTAEAVQTGLLVTAYNGDTATDFSATTDENGQATLNLPEGSYRFQTIKNGTRSYSGETNHCTIPTCTTAGITVPVFGQVTVTVADSVNTPQSTLPVFAYNGDTQTGYNSITDNNGQVTLTLPEGSYRFRSNKNSVAFYSGTENHCTVPTCTSAQVTLPVFGDVTVMVTNVNNEPQTDVPVYAYTGETYTGYNGRTDSTGQATISLPEGSYHFRATLHDFDYFSSTEDSCTVPTCTAVSIDVPEFGALTVTVSDSASTPQPGLTVTAMNGEVETASHGTTGENGQVILLLPDGDYRFKVVTHTLDYFSAENNTCTVPTCTEAAIAVPIFGQMTVSVVNTANVAQPNLPVYVYRVVEITPEATATPEPTPTEEPTQQPTEQPTEEPEDNVANQTELVETGISGTTDAEGHVTFDLPEDTYRFRTDLYGHQYFSDEENPVIVPTDTTASITVPVFADVTVTVVDRDQETQPNLTVYAYDGETYSGASGTTDGYGNVHLMLPEGGYRFRADQYNLPFWSNATNDCTVPTCTTATVTVLGSGYSANDQTISYTYDNLNRLTAADYDNGLYYHYTYDAVGNRTAQESAFNTVTNNHTYTYDNANRLTAVDNQDYTFDENGNMTSDGVYTYSYDSANRLTGVNKEGTAISYSYNGQGDRVQQTVNGVVKNFTLDLNSGLPQVLAYDTETYIYGLDRLGYEKNSEDYQYLADALGSVRQVVKASGAYVGLTLSQSYDPYGNVLSTNGETSSYGFTGEWTDSTGMVYLRARTYNPVAGTFLSKDPWSGDANSPMSYNKWMYGYGNPVKYTDPSGQNPLLGILGAGVTGFVIGVLGGAIFAECTYELSLSGQCGCDMQQQALSMSKQDWKDTIQLAGGIIGAAMGAVAAVGPGFTVYIGITGGFLSLVDLANTIQIAINETGFTACTGIRIAFDVIGLISSTKLIKAGWKGVEESSKWYSWKKPPIQRSPNDIDVSPNAPKANNGVNGYIGTSLKQIADLQYWLRVIKNMGATDIRVGQNQVNYNGQRVGINLPDLQFSLNNRRYYVEWDSPSSGRGIPHAQRIASNDPSAYGLLQLGPNDPLPNLHTLWQQIILITK